MALTQKLELRQSQALVMTPQLMQAIKLLQLSNLDLVAYVDAELERNPLLERLNEEAEPQGPEPSEPEPGPPGDPGSGDWLGQDLATSRTAIEDQLGTKLDNVFPDDAGSSQPRPEAPAAYSEWAGVGAGGRDESDYNLEAFVTAETTLADHLAEQLALAVADPARRMIGQYLIDLVDEAGYLPQDLGGVADKLAAPPAEIEAVLAVLQSLDPPGVCARNLNECLSIQLKERDRFDPAMQCLVKHLDLLAKRDLQGLRKVCGVDDEDLSEMIAEIRHLNPKPGLAFGSTVVQPIVPDVFVHAGPDGGWLVELNSDTLPKILVNQNYYAQIIKTARGVQHLRPLNLKAVADAIGMHESTVSRVTANKYMATNRGIFELKYFFTSAIAAADGGEAHSAEAVRHRIKLLIDAEQPQHILSDDTIVEKLREAGIDIARRTVAKYREAMRIPSSVQRRRDKQGAVGAAT